MFDFLLFKKQTWALVKSFTLKSQYRYYHIHCFESNKGNRKVEYVCDGEQFTPEPKGFIYKSDLYQMQIYRWLSGRRDPEIPTYDQIGEEDTANFLKGKVS